MPAIQPNSMVLKHLSLTHFRNYSRLELSLPPGPILLYGDNAQGKTNLLEAIFYLATTRSPHAAQDQQLIQWEADRPDEPVVVGRLVADVETNAGMQQLELRLIRERKKNNHAGSFRREALINRRKVRLMDLIGSLRVVLFLPEDIQLVGGPPAHRRRFVDILICQVDPTYCRTLSTYNKVLEQRNALLRKLAETGRGHDLLPVYNDKLATLGSQIFLWRAKHLRQLDRLAQAIHYEKLTDRLETMRFHYLPRLEPRRAGEGRGQGRNAGIEAQLAVARWLQEQPDHQAIIPRFRQSLQQAGPRDLAVAASTVGPHRDDWSILVNGRSLADFGSRGQQRSAILALKLAEIAWMQAQTGDMPILLLDEVVAELDGSRRQQLLAVVGQANQALLTATDPGMFPPAFLKQALGLAVQAGRVQPHVPPQAQADGSNGAEANAGNKAASDALPGNK